MFLYFVQGQLKVLGLEAELASQTGIRLLRMTRNTHIQCIAQVIIDLDINAIEYYVIIINVMITNNIFYINK